MPHSSDRNSIAGISVIYVPYPGRFRYQTSRRQASGTIEIGALTSTSAGTNLASILATISTIPITSFSIVLVLYITMSITDPFRIFHSARRWKQGVGWISAGIIRILGRTVKDSADTTALAAVASIPTTCSIIQSEITKAVSAKFGRTTAISTLLPQGTDRG